ncbi:MAG: hypothetical protein GXO14_03815 [Thermococci archaeon]|nr:hypothetical protein [Thermococci archaeon]
MADRLSQVIQKPELQILINLLGSFDVSYPPYGLKLFSVRPTAGGYSVRVTADRGDFRASHPDLPTFSDFYECFISSGIVSYDNVYEFERQLELYDSLKKGVAFAPDTNVLYHRFISNFRPMDGRQIVVAEGVKWEVENAMNYKYRNSQLLEIMSLVRNPGPLRELRNRRTKRSRKAAYIALREFEKLKSRIIVAERYGTGHNNDEIIIKTLKHYDEMTPTLLVFLTADRAITDVAEMEGLEYFLFQYPTSELGEHGISAYQLRTLIFNLAAIFGVVELGGTLVYGEFGGKAGLDELKLIFGDEGLFKDFEFHLMLSRKLMGILR